MANLSLMKTAVIILLLHCASGVIIEAEEHGHGHSECGEDNCIINRCYTEGETCEVLECGDTGCQLDHCMGAGPICSEGQCPEKTYCAADNKTCIPETPINVAFNKPTNSKSNSVNAVPNFGNDYTTLRFISSPNAPAHHVQWWCVNLELNYEFKEIVLYNHLNWNGTMFVPDEKIKGFEIRVSNVGLCLDGSFDHSTVCYKDNNTDAQRHYLINDCNQGDVGFSGRSIYIGLEHNQLEFADLAVYPKEHICETNHHCLGYGVCVDGKCRVPKCDEKYCFSDVIRVPT